MVRGKCQKTYFSLHRGFFDPDRGAPFYSKVRKYSVVIHVPLKLILERDFLCGGRGTIIDGDNGLGKVTRLAMAVKAPFGVGDNGRRPIPTGKKRDGEIVYSPSDKLNQIFYLLFLDRNAHRVPVAMAGPRHRSLRAVGMKQERRGGCGLLGRHTESSASRPV
jgi:hypothetical protein